MAKKKFKRPTVKKSKIVKKKFKKPSVRAFPAPRGRASAKAKQIRLEYIADAYKMDLKKEVEAESAGVRKTIYAVKVEAKKAQVKRFQRIRGKLFRDKKTGKFVNAKKVERFVKNKQYRDEIKLFMQMHGATQKDARWLRKNNRREFNAMLNWGNPYK